MKSGSVLVRKQPPPAVLVDEVFEFVAESESNTEERDLEWVVDPRVKVVQEPRKARHGNPTMFQCCFTQQSSNVAISISLTKKDGTVVSSTSTTPVSTAVAKVLVSKTPEWSDVWFKDEGGREKCMELIAGVYNQRKDLIKSTSTVQISLCYATNHHGTVPVANQDILRLLNTDLRAGPDGTVKIRYRVEDVSKNHQGQDFCLLVGVANRSDIAHGIGPPVKIRSKRNKRGRGGQNGASKSTKKVVRAEDHNLHATLRSVSAWAEDVARAIYPWQQNDPTFRQLLVRYDKQVRIGLKRVGNVLQNPHCTETSIIYPSPQPVPSSYSQSQPWPRHFPPHNNAHHPQSSEHFNQWSPSRYRADSHFGNHITYPNPGACMVQRDANTSAAEVVLGRACEHNGRVLGLPVFSLGNELVGFLQPNCALRREFDDGQKTSALSMLNRKEIPRFSRRNDGVDYLQRAIAAVRFQKVPIKPMNEVEVPVVGTATESSERLTAPTPAQLGRSPTPESDIAEGDVEFIVSQTFKSLESGEVLGFPAYNAEKQMVGFYKQNQGGDHRFVGLPDAFGPQQLRAAKEILEQAGDSVQSRSRHRSVFSMINHALVFEFSHDIIHPEANRGHDI